VLLSPYTPMLFMGEEYGELAPFPFFVDHTDPDVLRATNEGRRAEFEGADWSVEVPEPGARSTFESAVLDPSIAERDERSAGLLAMYTELLRLRREMPSVASPKATQQIDQIGGAVIIRRALDGRTTTVVINESDPPVELPIAGTLAFASDDPRWGGSGGTAVVDRRLSIAGWTVALVG
jgi:maltooligosyltrehalose trehalohydrolase